MSIIKNDVNKLIPTKDYVLVKDSFMSWGERDPSFPFEVSLVALQLDDYDQEQIIMDNVDNRSDWHYIDTQSGRDIKNDYKDDKKFNIKIMTKESASRMYKKGGFS